jgi:hypothetical protein
MTPKVRIIPPLNQDRISGNISVQFWLKTTIDFQTWQSIFKLLFNKRKNEYFQYFHATETQASMIPEAKQFIQKWNSPDHFRSWARINIDFHIEYVGDATMRLSISNYLNGQRGTDFFYEYTGASFFQFEFMDIVFGDFDLTQIKLNL